ncbi:SapC family protein [Lamprobacter modestohalophilus]|uniref:SapC family protein n=1 Tax=Lamprobacter modestohalophilus TaxID=1064514 RepID=UPI002ADEDF2B|nr:SapC family protein [Lamprobacter modestohalophilus]MEA1053009.1 SapC family protein [Lamprobacter modestohalophilus]
MYQHLVVLNAEHHRQQRFTPPRDLSHARGLMSAEIVAAEVAQVLASFPLAFLYPQPEQPMLAALFSLEQDRNWFVLPDGRWAVTYIPALVRAWPFALHWPPNAESGVLCIDEAAFSDEPDAELLFDDQGGDAPALARARTFANQYGKDLQATRRATRRLHEAGLITPWPLKLQRPDGQPSAIEGLWHLDEAALKQLPAATLADLCTSGALGLAYAQLLSHARLENLQKTAAIHATADEKKQQLDEQMQGLFGGNDGGSLTFDF